ncbi:xeroderma pigmentosum group G family protein [Heterostelium album PN500]|uniref:Xeroderma pigmentosum group G family protein n=1 Tax=Heterostelium pallidum (strain ATCC 26659 / Pp 5 / PN500) TaxID=670386 RepID=D3AVU4_HETP5|nr:xeroderma pigmentosum group G family protein [Heterostelium album PN500]EFA86417.1 xeroderma pigmentosum group G family protein [Heterostelium album PN500]|eukprot:XP_020438522.1 xeroderma pigmentosum group G family protein [Heterostelium album PN500]
MNKINTTLVVLILSLFIFNFVESYVPPECNSCVGRGSPCDMGVPKLWELVQPSGSYVELRDLEGQTLAIDASIWIHSFIRAFKDSRGDPAENAHLLGFFWRICKLLQHRIKPIFVFDGNIPYLKQRTINERRKRRENSLAQLEKNQRKMVLLKTIKAQINKSRGIIDEQQFDHLFNDLDHQEAGGDTYDFDKEDEVDSDLEIIDYDSIDHTNISQQTLPSKDIIDKLFNNNNKNNNSNNNKNNNNNSIDIDSFNNNNNNVFQIEDDSDDDYINNNNDIRNVERVFMIEDDNFIGEYESQFVHNFNSDEIDQQVFSQLPEDIQIEVLSQMKQEKKLQDKLSLLTPPKTPIDFSKHQIGSLLEKGKLTRKINEVREHMQSEVKGVSTDGDTVFMLHKTPTPSKSMGNNNSQSNTPFSTPLKPNSLSGRISSGATSISPKSKKQPSQSIHYDSTSPFSNDNDNNNNSNSNSNKKQPITSILNQISANNLNNNKSSAQSLVVDKSDMYSKLEMMINRKSFLEPKSKVVTTTSTTPPPTPTTPPKTTTTTTTTTTRSSLLSSSSSSSSPSSSSRLQLTPTNSKSMFGSGSSGVYYGDEEVVDHVDSSSKRNLLDELFGSVKKKNIRDSDQSDYSGNNNNSYDDVDIDLGKNNNNYQTIDDNDNNNNNSYDNNDDIPDFNQRIIDSDDDDIPDFNQRIIDNDEKDSFKNNKTTTTKSPSKPTTISTAQSSFKIINNNNSNNNSQDDKPIKQNNNNNNTIKKDNLSSSDGNIQDDSIFNVNSQDDSNSSTQSNINNNNNSKNNNDNCNIDSNKKVYQPILDIDKAINEIKRKHNLNNENVNNHLHEDDIDEFVNNNNNNTTTTTTTTSTTKQKSKFDDIDIFDVNDENNNNDNDNDNDTSVNNNDDNNNNNNIDIDNNNNNGEVFVRDDGVVINAPKFNSLELRNYKEEERLRKLEEDNAARSKTKPIFEYFTSKEAETLDKELELEKISSSRQILQQIKSIKTIDDDILRECHDLLSLFGIPFITSPTEAEAQCAELFALGLIDGVVTEDSDTLLFGKSSDMVVYRHLFQQPEKYCMSDIEKTIGVNRDDLINLAMLLGCDYTAGVKGIGIVNAMEIISEFDTLEEFAKFIRKDYGSGKKSSRDKDKDGDKDKDENDEDLDIFNEERYRFKTLLKNIKLPDSFPSEQVRLAFQSPDVNLSSEEFTWSCPDLDSLRKLTRDKFGWDKLKVDNILLPILRLNNSTQPSNNADDRAITSGKTASANAIPTKFKSKRLTEAIDRLISQKGGQSIPRIASSSSISRKRIPTKRSTPTKKTTTPSKKTTTPTKRKSQKSNDDDDEGFDDFNLLFDNDDGINNGVNQDSLDGPKDIDIDMDGPKDIDMIDGPKDIDMDGPKDIDLGDINVDKSNDNNNNKTDKEKKKEKEKEKEKSKEKEKKKEKEKIKEKEKEKEKEKKKENNEKSKKRSNKRKENVNEDEEEEEEDEEELDSDTQSKKKKTSKSKSTKNRTPPKKQRKSVTSKKSE